jgi:hypothetical protein
MTRRRRRDRRRVRDRAVQSVLRAAGTARPVRLQVTARAAIERLGSESRLGEHLADLMVSIMDDPASTPMQRVRVLTLIYRLLRWHSGLG